MDSLLLARGSKVEESDHHPGARFRKVAGNPDKVDLVVEDEEEEDEEEEEESVEDEETDEEISVDGKHDEAMVSVNLEKYLVQLVTIKIMMFRPGPTAFRRPKSLCPPTATAPSTLSSSFPSRISFRPPKEAPQPLLQPCQQLWRQQPRGQTTTQTSNLNSKTYFFIKQVWRC